MFLVSTLRLLMATVSRLSVAMDPLLSPRNLSGKFLLGILETSLSRSSYSGATVPSSYNLEF